MSQENATAPIDPEYVNENEAYYYGQGNGIQSIPAEHQRCYVQLRFLGGDGWSPHLHSPQAIMDWLEGQYNEDFNEVDMYDLSIAFMKRWPAKTVELSGPAL